MRDAVIVGAVRSAVGKRNGKLSGVRPDDLAADVLRELVARVKIDPTEVEDVILGCVDQLGEQGFNIARNAALIAGFPLDVCGTTLDRMCGSGQQAANFAAMGVMSGQYECVIAGGVENMTRVPMGSNAMGPGEGPLSPRLQERFNIVPQGISAELIAETWGLKREELDGLAAQSHEKAGRAIAEGRFKREITPVTLPDGTVFDTDEGVRVPVNREKMAQLAPSFKPDGVITAANASQISDGAAALMVMSADRAKALGLKPRARAHRGLAPQIVESVRLPADTGLVRWLAVQGRPARIHDLTDADIIRELKLLQSVLAVPLLAHGELVAVLVVGQPVVGSSYGRPETETLFDLATHLATAIRDISLHHQLQREKEFTERILEHMSSGVITIGRDQRVTIMNRRAEEILGVLAASIVDEDLRALPSPLGDMLYDTLRTGRAVDRAELQLALRGLWLEVSTYPVRGDDLAPLGAVLVFGDLTAQKELAAQRRQAEQTQLLTRVVARIAEEIKNPLVSINTFIELIGERYDDPDFRKHFSSVVRRDVRRLVEVFEKLAALVTEGELNFTVVDVHTVVVDVVTAIELADEAPAKPLQLDVSREAAPQLVKVDAAHLRRALSYLVWYLTHNSPPNQARVSIAVGRHAEREGTERVRLQIASRTASVSPDKLHRVFDPVQMVQESLIDVGPAVSQRLIEALGGDLRVRQARNELAFVVSLPVAAA